MASLGVASQRRSRAVPLRSWLLAAASIGAAGIHFAVIGEHLSEYAAFGVFFAVVAWLQALWAVAIVGAPTRPVILAGLIGNAVVVLVWVVSRTAGLPLGPEPRVAEPAAFVDVLSTVLEILIVVGAATLLRGSRGATTRRGGLTLVVGWFLVVALLSSLAIARSAGAEAQTHMTGSSTARSSTDGTSSMDMQAQPSANAP